MIVPQIIEWVSGALWWIIGIWGVISLLLFLRVQRLAHNIARRLCDRLHNIMRIVVPAYRPDRDSERLVYDEIAVMLQALRDIVSSPQNLNDVSQLEQWITDRDADRLEMKRHQFEKWYNFARVQIEVLPLAGICGTLGRMAFALNQSALANAGDNYMVNLTAHFANSLASTLAALVFTIILMWMNSVFEPAFERLIELRSEYRDIIALARRALAGMSGSPK